MGNYLWDRRALHCSNRNQTALAARDSGVLDEVTRNACKTGSQLPSIEVPSICNGFRPILAEFSLVHITTTHNPAAGNATEHHLLLRRRLIVDSDLQFPSRMFSVAECLFPPFPPRPARILKIGFLLLSCQVKERQDLVFFPSRKDPKRSPQIPPLDRNSRCRRIERFSTASVAGKELLRDSAGRCTCPRVNRLGQYARSPS